MLTHGISKWGEGKPPSLTLPLLHLPFLDRTRVSSPLLTGTISEEGSEQSPNRLTIAHVIFIEVICNPRRKGYFTWSMEAKRVGFASPLWATWSTTAVGTWPEAQTRIREVDFCELGVWRCQHIRGEGDGVSRTAVLPIYVQDPLPLRCPVEWLTPGYICGSKNIG